MNHPAAIAGVSAASALAEGRGEGPQGRRYTVMADRILAALEASSARPELLRELRNFTQFQASLSLLLQANGQASLVAGPRQLTLPPGLGESLLKLAGSPVAESAIVRAAPPPSPAASPTADTSFIGRLLAAAMSAAPRLGGLLSGATERPTVPGQRALLEPEPGRALDTLGAAGRLRYTLEMSGLFYEAHLKQWARGQRSESLVREELARMLSNGLARADGPDWSSPVPGGGERVVAQLALLHKDVLGLAVPAWSGQALEIEIEREARSGAADGGSAPVHRARLTLDLPRLGRIEAQLRLAGDSVAVHLRAPRRALLEGELELLSRQLEARGLRAVSLVVEDET